METTNKNWWETETGFANEPIFVESTQATFSPDQSKAQEKQDARQTLWWSFLLVTFLIASLGYYGFLNSAKTGSANNPSTQFVYDYANGSAALYRKAAGLIESGEIRDNKDLVDFVSKQTPVIRDKAGDGMKPYYESLNGEGWDAQKAIEICQQFAAGFDAVTKGK